jgi:hypothetical protein
LLEPGFVVVGDRVAEYLDELAELGEVWKRNREVGRGPLGCREGMVATAKRLGALVECKSPFAEFVDDTLREMSEALVKSPEEIRRRVPPLEEIRELFHEYEKFNEIRDDGLIYITDTLDDFLVWLKRRNKENGQ